MLGYARRKIVEEGDALTLTCYLKGQCVKILLCFPYPLEQTLYLYIGSGNSSAEPAILHCHIM